MKFRIKKLIASGRGEFSIYSLINSLDDYLKFMDYRPEIQYRIADVKDFAAMEKIFKEYKPDIVFHAAAHKHVPLMEFNETEAIKNNVLGTWNILKLCHKYSVAEFILISTDKAVKPVNIMGATKRVAELITQFYHREKKLKTSIVRFGNVIGSRGSVIPLFREQIEKGGPVTITHPEIKRYFMSIPEASLLVVNAAAYSAGGDLFILDMGGQYRIQDIAKKLIIHYGYKPDVDIKIEYTGLRPGEKMNEELYYDMENLKKTGNEKIFVLSIPDNIKAEKRLIKYLTKKLKYIDEFTPDDAREMLKNAIPEFKS
ncbi:MAG: polysaccharide biosynthesis protein [Spirochaetes bacterium]|nr:polysaccharide biosynthesis protein [Spirochaetota bacterium]